jgi:hypothetical protein
MRSLRFFGLAGIALAISLAACDGPAPTQPTEGPSPLVMGYPGNPRRDPAEITAARLEGDVLHLQVRYGGGCRQHYFSLVHTGAFTKSIPPQTSLTLTHDASGDACEALVTTNLAFDVSPLRRLFQDGYGEHGTLVVHVHAPAGSGAPAATVLYQF